MWLDFHFEMVNELKIWMRQKVKLTLNLTIAIKKGNEKTNLM